MTITLREIKRYPGQRIVRRDLECRGADTRPIAATRSVFCFGARIERFPTGRTAVGCRRTISQPQPRREDRIAVRELRAGAHPIDSFGVAVGNLFGNTEMPVGRLMLDQFFSGFTPAGSRGNPKLVEAGTQPSPTY